jgi:hypothetical protein
LDDFGFSHEFDFLFLVDNYVAIGVGVTSDFPENFSLRGVILLSVEFLFDDLNFGGNGILLLEDL